MADIAVIIVAAGRGLRAGGGEPKQYRLLDGAPVLAHTLRAFAAHPLIGRILTVIHPDDRPLYDAIHDTIEATATLLPAVAGGDTRQMSVRAGLEALATEPPDYILIHDAARPFVTADLIERAVGAARLYGAAVPGIPMADTVKVVDSQGKVRATPDRASLYAVQTPQAFHYTSLQAAHAKANEQGIDGLTDDAAIAEWSGMAVQVFEGDTGNMKLTRAEDIEAADRRMRARHGYTVRLDYTVRLGTGYDVHAFADGDHIWLGGVRIDHTRGILAHSDGDVVLHALTDAVLGALADGDIGSHFPPSDPQWKGASSDRFLIHALDLLRARGGVLDHLDATVICETPKIGPHREAIRARIADICGLPLDAVSIKATTSERLGFTGRQEGIAAQAAATIRLPL